MGGNIEGAVNERITALMANGSDIWVGTCVGRLLTQHDNKWILQGQLKGIQITGIAVEGTDKVWLSTSDGIRRLEREGDQPWQVSEFRYYYEGHPAFVSGAYIHDRKSDNNEKDGTEFSFIGPEEIGCKLDRVADLAAAADHGVWAILTFREDGSALARFDGNQWETHTLDGPAQSVVEVESGVVLIGVYGTEWGRYRGLRKVTWASKELVTG